MTGAFSRAQIAGFVGGFPELVMNVNPVLSSGANTCVSSSGGIQQSAAYITHDVGEYVFPSGERYAVDPVILNERGERLLGKEAVQTTMKGWRCGELQREKGERMVGVIVIAIPERKPEVLAQTVLEWSAEHLKAHPHVLAVHTDRKNTHCHLLFKNKSDETGKGFDLPPREIRRFREDLAERLQERGVRVRALPSYLRETQESRSWSSVWDRFRPEAKRARDSRHREKVEREAKAFMERREKNPLWVRATNARVSAMKTLGGQAEAMIREGDAELGRRLKAKLAGMTKLAPCDTYDRLRGLYAERDREERNRSGGRTR